MRALWALLAVALGALGTILVFRVLGSLVGRPDLSPNAAHVLMAASGLAMLYAGWRSALRARRTSITMRVAPASSLARRRLVASFAFAIIAMFLSWAAGFVLAVLERDKGLLFWIVAFSMMPLKLRLKEAEGVAFWCVEFALLAAIFYGIATWRATRRARRQMAA